MFKGSPFKVSLALAADVFEGAGENILRPLLRMIATAAAREER